MRERVETLTRMNVGWQNAIAQRDSIIASQSAAIDSLAALGRALRAITQQEVLEARQRERASQANLERLRASLQKDTTAEWTDLLEYANSGDFANDDGTRRLRW